jgi:hypothetical protein
MNANLRGDVRVKGLPIEEFVKNIVKDESTSTTSEDTVVKTSPVGVEDLIRKKMQPLEAFQDEKKIMTDALSGLMTRITDLERKGEGSAQTAPSMDFKPDLDALTLSVETVENKVKLDIEALTASVNALSTSLEKVEKKLSDMKPRRGVDQGTLDNAISAVEQMVEDKVKGVSDALAQLRKELEE